MKIRVQRGLRLNALRLTFGLMNTKMLHLMLLPLKTLIENKIIYLNSKSNIFLCEISILFFVK